MNHLFGFLQIVIESLPISSSGHLALLGLDAPVAVERFLHGPTVLVVLVYFYKELWALACNYKAEWRKLLCWGIVIVFANSFTVLVYALLEKFNMSVPLWVGFAITSCALLSLKLYSLMCFDTTRLCIKLRRATQHERGEINVDEHEQQSYLPRAAHTECFEQGEKCIEVNGRKKLSLFVVGAIGIVQGFARLGGVSRLGVTYVTAVWLGFEPKKAFRISCALQVPLFAAGFLEGAWGLFKAGNLGYFFSATIVVAGLFAMALAYCLLAWVEHLMVNNKLWYLGVYMTVSTLLVLLTDLFLVGI